MIDGINMGRPIEHSEFSMDLLHIYGAHYSQNLQIDLHSLHEGEPLVGDEREM